MKIRRLGNICFAILMALCLALLVAGCRAEEQSKLEVLELKLSSPAFSEGKGIPVEYTDDGEDISPPLVWSGLPSETQSLAIIMDDPDAPGGVFTHWVLFNLPPDTRELPEAVTAESRLPSDALQGKNDFGRIGYAGPAPPPGREHRYRFTLYALNQPLNLVAGVSKNQVIDAMPGHILAQGQLTGIYQR